jgi:hypothetical protein
MAVTLITVPGAVNANSYANEGEFIGYAATRLNVVAGTTVTGSTCSENEKIALIEAAREITNMAWTAQRTFLDQALAWPQRYCLNPDAPAITGITDIAQLYFDPGLILTAGAFVVGTNYTIVSVGSTDFTAIGAASNTVGVQFVATDVGIGTGTACQTSSVPTRVKNAQIELALEFLKAGATDIAVADPNAGIIRKRVDVLETQWSPFRKAEGIMRYPRVIAYIAPMLALAGGALEVSRS